MISKQQLLKWEKQNAKDIQQFNKDEQSLKQFTEPKQDGVRAFFERMRAKYFNFHSEDQDKLNRLLIYAEASRQMENYPKITKVYLTYNTASILLLAVSILAPKKIISKILISIVLYGLKTNIGDGLFTYHMIEQMALSQKMTQKEQQLRYILEFYYKHKKFTTNVMTPEQQNNAEKLLAQMRRLNQKYYNFKRVENLL